MRKILIRELEKLTARPDFCLLTGDLGFMVLEPLQKLLGDRFINAGIAEQNMISVAAGMAKRGFKPWIYSIAPFVYARPFEQVRRLQAEGVRVVNFRVDLEEYGWKI